MAFLVCILGSIAIGMLSGICGQMTPSPPPGWDGHPELTGAPTQWWHASRDAIHRHSFAVLFVALFLAKSALRLAHYATEPRLRSIAAVVLRVTRRFSEHWFSLLVKNAFAAFIGVVVIQFVQQFSPTNWIWNAVMGVVGQIVGGAARLVGAGLPELVQRWLSWFGDNQTKFSFWLLYSAAICDDLGLPNYKTLARLAWKRVRRRIQRRAVPAGP